MAVACDWAVLFCTRMSRSNSIHSGRPRMAVQLVNPSHLSFGIDRVV